MYEVEFGVRISVDGIGYTKILEEMHEKNVIEYFEIETEKFIRVDTENRGLYARYGENGADILYIFSNLERISSQKAREFERIGQDFKEIAELKRKISEETPYECSLDIKTAG